MRQDLERYFRDHGVSADRLTKADLVLALLRIGEVAAAEKLMGKPIQKCPPCMPPWPPKPASERLRGERAQVQGIPAVQRVGRGLPRGTVLPKTRRKIQSLEGLTREQALQRVTQREIRRWTRLGLIRWEQPRRGSGEEQAIPALDAAAALTS